ncbi:MAG: type VII toxin-antitoxin system HepT family RNase toxin [Tepidanaerobacteraceae bacterium]
MRRLTFLEEYCSDLDEARQNINREKFQDKVVRRYIERTLHMAIEACLDIANHIVSYEGYREPVDNKDIFQVLFEQKILDERLTENLKKMAQFRNVIVHDYIRIQPEIVYAILQKNLGDILEFANLIKERFL